MSAASNPTPAAFAGQDMRLNVAQLALDRLTRILLLEAALAELYRVCVQMDCENLDKRPEEAEYQAAMAAAEQVLHP